MVIPTANPAQVINPVRNDYGNSLDTQISTNKENGQTWTITDHLKQHWKEYVIGSLVIITLYLGYRNYTAQQVEPSQNNLLEDKNKLENKLQELNKTIKQQEKENKDKEQPQSSQKTIIIKISSGDMTFKELKETLEKMGIELRDRN
jgi:cell division protein FtsB